jgi:hypothetical protein
MKTHITLELLFQSTYYHLMPPDLSDPMGFENMMDLAEAAGKYMIDYARAICVMHMRYAFSSSLCSSKLFR